MKWYVRLEGNTVAKMVSDERDPVNDPSLDERVDAEMDLRTALTGGIAQTGWIQWIDSSIIDGQTNTENVWEISYTVDPTVVDVGPILSYK